MLTDIVRTDVLTAASDTTVAEVVDAMRSHGRSFVVVLDEQHPLGLLSAARIGLSVGRDDPLADRAAVDLAVAPVTIRERASRGGLLARFRETDADRLVVVDDGDEFVGCVSRRDLLATYADEFGDLFELFQ
jgi:CBS domain-containing protein